MQEDEFPSRGGYCKTFRQIGYMAVLFSHIRELMAAPDAIYRPRNPQNSDYYLCVQDHFEAFLQLDKERFERQYLLSFSWKHRHFYPSCHQKRVVEFEE